MRWFAIMGFASRALALWIVPTVAADRSAPGQRQQPSIAHPSDASALNTTRAFDKRDSTTARLAARDAVLATFSNDIDSHPLLQRDSCSICGRCTNYDVGLGSCGDTDTNADWLLALPNVPWNSPECHRTVSIAGEGIVREAPVKDCCPGCSSYSTPVDPAYLPVADLSPALFGQFANADNSVGPGWFACCWYFS